MQTNENILSQMAENLKRYSLSPATQKQYLRISRAFLVWSNINAEDISEEDIGKYLSHLTNIQKLDDSTIKSRSAAIRLLFGTVTGDNSIRPQPRRRLVRNGCLREDRLLFVQHLNGLGYSTKSLKNYKWTIRCLDQFMCETGQSEYSHEVGESFLVEAKKTGRHTDEVLSMMNTVVRRFDWYKEGGEFILTATRISRKCPPQYSKVFTKYLESLRLKGIKESTIENHRRNIHKALLKFNEAGVQNCSEINAEEIYDAFEKTSDKAGFCSPVRGFLSYLFDIGAVPLDYSTIVPSVRKAQPAPSVYTTDEIKKLLNTCKKNTGPDSRAAAVMLLALRVGMRSGDIANLKITDVDFDSKEIYFVQEKTEIPQRLALLPEVEDAIVSYITSSRPDSDIPNVFLSIRSPFRAITANAIYSMVSRRFKVSGIDIKERKHGGHALRMTLASELIAEKVPYDAVRKILGHEDPVTTKHYVKFDIESLRSCAIKIPTVTGKLAEYMKTRLGGEPQ